MLEVDGLRQLDLEGYPGRPGGLVKRASPSVWPRSTGWNWWTTTGCLIDFLNRFYSEYRIAPELPVLARNLSGSERLSLDASLYQGTVSGRLQDCLPLCGAACSGRQKAAAEGSSGLRSAPGWASGRCVMFWMRCARAPGVLVQRGSNVAHDCVTTSGYPSSSSVDRSGSSAHHHSFISSINSSFFVHSFLSTSFFFFFLFLKKRSDDRDGQSSFSIRSDLSISFSWISMIRSR